MRKGILLAGGKGSRLYPLTKAINKHFLQVYDKPMIYYPLSTLMLAGIRDILIITNEEDIAPYKNLLGNGQILGINIKYAIQEKPEGVAQSFLIASKFLDRDPSALILGDNIFHGNQLVNQLNDPSIDDNGATVFAYPVKDPQRYGVVGYDSQGKVSTIEEKPVNPRSNFAITGLYFYDNTVIEKAANVKKSLRNELEITSINKQYMDEDSLRVVQMGRGTAWLDAGTHDTLHNASSYIKIIQQRQGLIVGCLEEIAWRKKWINDSQLNLIIESLNDNYYKKYLNSLINN